MRVVVKVGGSFQGSPFLKKICRMIDQASQENDLVIVPGGGDFADQVRKFQKDHDLSDDTAHLMAVIAMEMYGIGLCELISELESTNGVENAKEGGGIFLPYKLVKEECELESSWKVTSDSLAAWICGRLGFDKLVLIKRVDGIGDVSLMPEITSGELKDLDQTVVDPKLPEVLEKYGVTGWIINGEYPERFEDFLEAKETKGTRVSPEV